jgi:hypothetical protein
MRTYTCLIIAATTAISMMSHSAFAQNRPSGSSLGGGAGAFGSSGFGAGGTGASAFGGTGASGFGAGGTGAGGLGTGTSGFGQPGMGQATAQPLNVFQPQQQGFVGRDSADVQQLMQAQAAQIQQAMQERSTAQMNRGRDINQETSPRPAIRVQLQVAFDYERPAVATVDRRIDSVFERVLNDSLASRGIDVPELVWNGRDVTLRGNVPDASSRRLIENMVKLQPGVGRVVNELTVESTVESSETESIPAGQPN